MYISEHRDACTHRTLFNVSVTEDTVHLMKHEIVNRIIEKVAEQLAKDILENNYAEIMEKVSPVAIANIAIAEAGAAVNETLHKKLPDKILEIEKRTTEIQMYQKGLLGGTKRVY